MQILNWELNSARILCAQIQFGLETHPAMYRDARTDENSNYPHFDLKRAHIQNRGVQGDPSVNDYADPRGAPGARMHYNKYTQHTKNGVY